MDQYKQTKEGNMSTEAVFRIADNIKKIKLRTYPQVIDVTGEIDEGLAQDFADQMLLAQSTGQPVIPIMIHSPGGDVYSLIKMINCIRQSPIPVATVVTGVAASAAACLFTCAPLELRFMTQDARLMVHSVSSQLFGSVNAASMKAEAKEAKKLNQRICEIMAENCRKPVDYFKKLLRKKDNTDVWIDCDKALKMGLITRTEIPVLISKITQTFSFETMNGKVIQIPERLRNETSSISVWDEQDDETSSSDSDSASTNSEDDVVEEEVVQKTTKEVESPKAYIHTKGNNKRKSARVAVSKSKRRRM
jgi:ATP-dependent Clp protease protease subunit